MLMAIFCAATPVDRRITKIFAKDSQFLELWNVALVRQFCGRFPINWETS